MRSTSSSVTTQQASKPATTVTSQQTRKRLPSCQRHLLTNLNLALTTIPDTCLISIFCSSLPGRELRAPPSGKCQFDRCYSGSVGYKSPFGFDWRCPDIYFRGQLIKIACASLPALSRLSKPAKTFHHACQPANAQAPPASLQPLLSNNLNLAITTIAETLFILVFCSFHFDILFFQPVS